MTDRKPYRHSGLARTDSLLGENSARLEQTGTRMGPARMRTLRRSSKPARFPLSSIQHALRLYHRFPRSERDVQGECLLPLLGSAGQAGRTPPRK